MNEDVIVLGPQKGPQTMLLQSDADIVIFGGAAGGGKSYGLLLDPLRYMFIKNFRATIFRKNSTQIRMQGALWDESNNVYKLLKARPRSTYLDWRFKEGLKVNFAHLDNDASVYDYQGGQVAWMGFDELTHFTEFQFFYMLSRNRSVTGFPGSVRATTNPDKRSWVRKLIDWWINPETGLAVPERSGVKRWFIRIENELIWANSPQELILKYGKASEKIIPKSLTFISSKIEDNQILMSKDPNYYANLLTLPRIERKKLLDGNWNIEPNAGEIFKKFYFEIVEAHPELVKVVRCWDKAATDPTKVNKKTKSNDPDYTVGVKLGVDRNNIYYVLDVVRERLSPLKVEQLILNTAKQDGVGTSIFLYQDPGAAGVHENDYYTRVLSGFDVRSEKIITNKVTNAAPASAQAEATNIKLLKGKWNEIFLDELEGFPDAIHDDQVDALSGAFNFINGGRVGSFTRNMNQSQRFNNMLVGNLSW